MIFQKGARYLVNPYPDLKKRVKRNYYKKNEKILENLNSQLPKCNQAELWAE